MPWEAPFVKVGKGASSGDAVDGSGEETGQGRAGNLVGKVLQQSLPKVPVKELEKTKPGKPVVKKVPKQKPRIDGPVFSQSPILLQASHPVQVHHLLHLCSGSWSSSFAFLPI